MQLLLSGDKGFKQISDSSIVLSVPAIGAFRERTFVCRSRIECRNVKLNTGPKVY